ncbi:MAG: sulfite exporter TauE/SafE family protein [Cyanobacteriota bacterium]|nr:sulfite exporter TauE/SafE family protein [Cyanobacteriota bacterium]
MLLSTLLLLGIGGGLIGFLLAVLGAGGSILLLPLLVSGAGLPTRAAVPLSLLIVMVLAVANAIPYMQRHQVAVKPALLLGLPALAGSWIGGSTVKAGWISEVAQLTIFALAALVASWLMLRQSGRTNADVLPLSRALQPKRSPWPLILQGMLVGLLTGIAGVGGGFAIVPALVLLAGLPMQLASGTSLLLIALNSLVALLALGHWPADQLPLMLPLLAGGGIGAVVGQRLAPHLKERQLRRGFAALLIGSALLTAGEALQRQPQRASSQSQTFLSPDHEQHHQRDALRGGRDQPIV